MQTFYRRPGRSPWASLPAPRTWSDLFLHRTETLPVTPQAPGQGGAEDEEALKRGGLTPVAPAVGGRVGAPPTHALRQRRPEYLRLRGY